MSRPSTTPISPGAPNPAYGYVEALMARTGDFRSVASEIIKLARSRYKQPMSPTDIVAFKRDCAEQLYELKLKFAKLLDEADEQRSKVQYAPSPPPSRELYGLVADGSEITDVGSGNCMRLQADSGRLKITAVDPLLPEKMATTVKRSAHAVSPSDVKGKVVTSFNSLIQLPVDVRDAVLQQDGLHMVPDHEALLALGCARKVETAPPIVVVQTPQREYHDNYLNIPGYPVVNGYKLCPSYGPRTYAFVTGDSQKGDYRPKIDCSPCSPADINWSDMGWKWDGVPYELEVLGGKIFATRRDGAYAEGVIQSDTDFVIHVELLPSIGVCVLLRVECFRGFIPPHCGDTLRHFADVVKITWNGMPVVGPPVVDYAFGPILNGIRAPIDGVITRSGQRDFYVKPAWTLDLYPEDLIAIQSKLTDLGKSLTFEAKPGFWEYQLTKSDEVYQLAPLRRRTDKTHATSAGTVDYLLTLPTIKEIVAVSGSTPDVEGLHRFFLEC